MDYVSMASQNIDACLQLVANQHRRSVLHLLRRDSNGTMTFDTLVDTLQSSVSNTKNGPLRNREELTIQLKHTHLPRLADYGVVEYDPRSGTVRYQPDERVETVLDSLPEEVSQPKPTCQSD